MSSQKRLSRVYSKARVVPFDDNSKFIFFSDVHRGDNGYADDFAKNRNIYYHALKHYFNEGFDYCELGDGDEMWEHLSFEPLFEAHKNVYFLLRRFHDAKRLHLIFGNHDMVYRKPEYVKKHLRTYFNPKDEKEDILFDDLIFHEGIVLRHRETGQEIFLTHGHQADFMNYHGWRFQRFMVRILWKPLQVWGIADPTSPAKNNRELIKIEKRIKRWIVQNKYLMTITGHTHRPRFPEPGEIPYFNDGSCVHPRSITGIELENGRISLIKWQIATRDDGVLQIVRIPLEGPQKIIDYRVEND